MAKKMRGEGKAHSDSEWYTCVSATHMPAWYRAVPHNLAVICGHTRIRSIRMRQGPQSL